MRLHRTLVNAVTDTITEIFSGGMYADKAVEHALKKDSRFGSRDRRFIAENVYGMVRWWRLITEIAGPGKMHDNLYLFMIWMIINNEELPDWEEFSGLDKDKIKKSHKELMAIRKIRESVPDWLDDIAAKELGETTWERELHELNKEAKVVLRTNTLKTNLSSLQSQLKQSGIETETRNSYPDALILSKRQSLHSLKEYKNGLFEIQDASSQLIAPFMELLPGMNVIDACAGAGGKSLHIAAMMNNKGNIVSMDIEERKLQELEKRSARGGARIIKTRLVNSQALMQLKNSADRLLLDVPCSGLGVIRRNPDAKWKLTEEFIETIKGTQQQIIRDYSVMLKPGGMMVYATCSILPGENDLQVKKFLEQNKNFEFVEDRKVMPSEGFDGFYMAKLRKKK
jgi:16S rRNA (cytosine967-C5)-methyltransferase